MKTMAWMTFVVTLALAALNLSRSSLDQQARNISSVTEVRAQAIAESASAVRAEDARSLRQISEALKRSSHALTP